MGRRARSIADSATDAEVALLARAAAGDERAVDELYGRYAGPLYGFGLRRSGDAELAEELVQRVLTKLWQLAERYDPAKGSVRTWVFMIARSTAVDLHRRRRRRDEPAREPVELADDHDELDRLLKAEMVRVALERLSPPHREVLDLAYFAGLTQMEVAARLGLPVGTVKSRTYYALKAFRLACDELGVEA